jgi:hypothetical protein
MGTALVAGCGEPSAPPPGAPTEKMEAPEIEVDEVEVDEIETSAPKDDAADPAEASEE